MAKARDIELEQAVARERARCLWCLDYMIAELRKQLDAKILEESKIHLIKVKVRIAQSIVTSARRLIVSGAKPKSGPVEEFEKRSKFSSERHGDGEPRP